jgi:adenosylcobinamide kinase/adenosylcobinamide-phosphate guanylyltransferase
MLYHNKTHEEIFQEVDNLLSLESSIVFVLNDVGTGIIPDNKLAREFIDLSGKISQKLGSKCDEVYHTIAGISARIK